MPEDIEVGSDTSTLPIYTLWAGKPNGSIFQPLPAMTGKAVMGLAEPLLTRNTNEHI